MFPLSLFVDVLSFLTHIDTYPERCNFENGFCGWSQDLLTDDFNWLIGVADVIRHSAATGPTRDHTKG